MKNFVNILITALVLSINCFLVSCDALTVEVDPKRIANNESLLVVNCYISPADTLLIAKLHKSSNTFGTEIIENNNGNYNYFDQINKFLVKDASVEISDGINKVELKFIEKEGLYIAKASLLKIKESVTYKLKIKDSNGKTYESETTIPKIVDFEVGKREKAQNNFNQDSFKYPILWNAPSNSFFRIGFYDEEINTFKSFDGTEVKTKNVSVFNGNSILEKNISANFKAFNKDLIFYNFNGSNSSSVTVKTEIWFLSVDENYYNYHESISGSFRNDNPFVEPLPVFSNIKNGLGCFGSFNRKEKNIKL